MINQGRIQHNDYQVDQGSGKSSFIHYWPFVQRGGTGTAANRFKQRWIIIKNGQGLWRVVPVSDRAKGKSRKVKKLHGTRMVQWCFCPSGPTSRVACSSIPSADFRHRRSNHHWFMHFQINLLTHCRRLGSSTASASVLTFLVLGSMCKGQTTMMALPPFNPSMQRPLTTIMFMALLWTTSLPATESFLAKPTELVIEIGRVARKTSLTTSHFLGLPRNRSDF